MTTLQAQLWHGIADTLHAPAQTALAEIVCRDRVALADAFYSFMVADADATTFLSVKTVEDRLKPGMQRWLERLYGHQGDAELQAVMAMQKHIGDVHARSEISVFLVARGMRVLKREIARRLMDSGFAHDQLVACLLRSDRLMDLAFEHMSTSYVQSHESRVRVDESYRLYAAGQNLSLEREKQLGALLEWENRLYRALATGTRFADITPLHKSATGLWLHHKAALIFDETRELPAIDECLRRVDEALLPQLAVADQLRPDELRALVKAVADELEQVRYLLAAMFDRLTDLEVGRDVLTQLFNRRFMQTILKREIELARRKNHPFCVLMLDIDRFKQVNDQHGHEVGDRVLQTIAGLMMSQVRASDFVFRFGGEEFVIILAETDRPQAQAVAEKIRRRIEQAEILLADNGVLRVTASIGIAPFDGHPDYQHLLERADKAMYQAKNSGRNRCILAG